MRATVKAQKQELEQPHLTCGTLQKENKILRKDNEQIKRILGNDSSNSSKFPSSDGPDKLKAPNKYNSRTKSKNSVCAQKGHQGKIISGKDVKELIISKRVKHEVIKDIGKQILDGIECNFYDCNYTVTEIAKKLGKNPSYINTVFKKVYGHTIKQSPADYRLKKTQRLLRPGNIKILDVANECGYSDIF